ncbi:MAG: hypothetical protein V1728_01405 [Candidatus Micrarchaeota archaeon]
MKKTLDAHLPYCGQATLDEIKTLADALSGQSVVHVNSTQRPRVRGSRRL